MQTNCKKYLPSGFVDYEGKNGTIKPGEWRSVIAYTRAPLLHETHLVAVRGLIHIRSFKKVRQRGEVN